MAISTSKTVTGFGEYKDQADAILTDAQNLYDSGALGAVEGFTDTQLDAQTKGIAAGDTQIGLEAEMAAMAGKTDLSGMRMAAKNDAMRALGLNSNAAGRMGGLGGSRQAINQGSIANNLAAQFGQIDMDRQAMDLTNTQAALDAQGMGAAAIAEIGQAQQTQGQNVLDSKYAGLTKLGEMFANLAERTSFTTDDDGGK